jgi:hypothetical protein
VASVLAEILTRLDIVVLERLPDGVFLRIGSAEPPPWYSQVFARLTTDAPVTVAEALPFIGHFLSEAEDYWREPREPRLHSDPFAIDAGTDGDLWLVASALVLGDRRFLILEMPCDLEERRRSLQSARENVLAHEEYVRRTGKLQTPLDAALKVWHELANSGLTPEQQQLAAAVRAHLASVSDSIASLAPLPRGVTGSGPR